MNFIVRPMEQSDVVACTDLLNHTISLGGTTAYEEPYSYDHFSQHYLNEPPVTHVVLWGDRIVGFQGAFDVGGGDLSIGSFADQRNPAKGAGRAIFPVTCDAARAKGYKRILAKITEDNVPGLAYYSALGFEDLDVIANDATRNGKPIARVIKAFAL